MTYIQSYMREALSSHILEEITPCTSPVRAFRLWRRETLRSVLATFTPDGIVLQGDLQIGDRGVLSRPQRGGFRYDLAWFSSDLKERDLCEVFLDEVWQPDVVSRNLRAIRGLDYLVSRVDLGCLDQVKMREMLVAHGLSISEIESIGYDFPLEDAGWLCAIQKRFAALLKREW